MVGERVAVLPDSAVRGFDISRLERRFTYDERVNDDAQGPDIYLVRVATLAFENFWGNIVWSSTDCSLLFSIKVELGGESKVA